MSTAINDSASIGLTPEPSHCGDGRLIFGVPYEAGERIVIPVAELLDGAGVGDGPDGRSRRELIQERSLGLIEIAGDAADFRPITGYRRSAVIGAVVLALMAIAVLLRSRARSRP